MPGFFVAFIFSCVVAGYVSTIDAAHPYGDLSYYLSRLNMKRIILEIFTFDSPRGARLFVNNPIPHRVNSPLWTIQFEVICYLLVPLFGLVSMARRKWLGLVFFLGSFITLVLQELSYIRIENDMHRVVLLYAAELPRLMAAFFGGACIYLYRDVVPRSTALAMLAAALFLFSSWWFGVFRIVLPVVGTYLVFFFAYHPGIRFFDFAKNGDLSYGMYLYGWPIQQMIIHFFYKYIGAHRLFFIAFPLAYIAAWLSWHLVESPFLKKKSQIKTLLARYGILSGRQRVEPLGEGTSLAPKVVKTDP